MTQRLTIHQSRFRTVSSAGKTSVVPLSATDNRAGQLCLNRHMRIHCRNPLHLIIAVPLFQNDDFDYELISGDHRMAEPAFVDPGKIDQLGHSIRVAAQQQYNANLCECFDQQYSGHDRMVRKMSLEKGLVDGHILEPYHAFGAVGFNNPVNQQKRVALRQYTENFIYFADGIAFIHIASAVPAVCFRLQLLNLPLKLPADNLARIFQVSFVCDRGAEHRLREVLPRPAA